MIHRGNGDTGKELEVFFLLHAKRLDIQRGNCIECVYFSVHEKLVI
jgi:hypothetical protein